VYIITHNAKSASIYSCMSITILIKSAINCDIFNNIPGDNCRVFPVPLNRCTLQSEMLYHAGTICRENNQAVTGMALASEAVTGIALASEAHISSSAKLARDSSSTIARRFCSIVCKSMQQRKNNNVLYQKCFKFEQKSVK